MQCASGFQSCKTWWKRSRRCNFPPRADHAHPGRGTKFSHFLADTAGANNANCLVSNDYWIVAVMIELVPPLIAVAQMKPAREVQEASQYILSHRAAIRKPARSRHDNS